MNFIGMSELLYGSCLQISDIPIRTKSDFAAGNSSGAEKRAELPDWEMRFY